MSNDAGIIEFVVSTGPGIRIWCTAAQDGSINIQTRNGSINILFRHAANAESHQSKNVDRRYDKSELYAAREKDCTCLISALL